MNTGNFRNCFVRAPTCRARRARSSSPPRVSGAAAVIALAAIAAGFIAAGSSAARATGGQKQSSSISSGNAQNGKLIFENQGCNKCHGSQGEGVSTPGQDGGVPRIASTTLALPAFVQLVRKPKGQMPPFGDQKVSDSDLADVYAFLQSLAPPVKHETSTAANTKNGQRLFTNYGCYECHGNQGQGSTQTGGSRLGPPQIPLSAFVSYVREPSGQMPPYTARAVSSEELADMYAFLQSLPQPPPSKNNALLNQ
jgi:mono/diheme cytochrome c family protein